MLPFARATDALDKLIDRDQDFRLLGTGFGFTEGPAWNTPGNYLVFSDIPGDRRWRWSEQRGMELVVAEKEFEQPNGLCFSPDESILYINDRRDLKAYDAAPDGSLSNVRVVHDDMGSAGTPGNGNPDGMECDEHGNVWCTARGGIWVIAPSGDLLGIIETPEVSGSLVWGGADMRSLFVCTSTTMHMIRTKVSTAPLPY